MSTWGNNVQVKCIVVWWYISPVMCTIWFLRGRVVKIPGTAISVCNSKYVQHLRYSKKTLWPFRSVIAVAKGAAEPEDRTE